MNHETVNNDYSPTILIVGDREQKKEFNSAILSEFNKVYFSNLECTTVLSWIQQNQPSLIIFKFDCPKKLNSDLISSLRLDWLTRNIPIIIMSNRFALQSIADLDYDAYLSWSDTTADLEKAVCSLINTLACQINAG